MKTALLLFAVAGIAGASFGLSRPAASSTCCGPDNAKCSPTGECTACKNCSSCKHCSGGGSCSVCKKKDGK